MHLAILFIKAWTPLAICIAVVVHAVKSTWNN
jgi:type IV secretory pathway VirB3-like protein